MGTNVSLEELYADATRSSLRKDGSRDYVHPADVDGRYTRIRRALFLVLVVVFAALPWIHIGGRPAVFLNIPRRQFFLFGLTFNAQDFWLAFFLLSAIGFLLITMTALLGRIWCGYACPQTVYLEGVFRRVERWLEGPRNARLKRNAGPMTFDKAWRKILKHIVFVMLCATIAHVTLSYFVSVPKLRAMMTGPPSEHPEAFVWATAITALLYINFAWFREQLCLIVCPYGRLQSLLTDQQSLVIGYDATRGEPRGRRGKRQLEQQDAESFGDCIDCHRCVVVCPTGIDIRNGLQLDCIGCSNCVDACDEIMTKVGKPKGLVRYDSLAGFEGKKRQFLRPRLAFYALLGLAGLGSATAALAFYTPFEANLLRASSAPYTVSEGSVRNTFVLHLVNKSPDARVFELSPSPHPDLEFELPTTRIRLAPLQSKRLPVSIVVPAGFVRPATRAEFAVESQGTKKRTSASVLGPSRR